MSRASRARIVESLIGADSAASRAAESAKEALARKDIDADSVLPFVQEYVFAKYRLEPDDCNGLSLEDLANASLAKTLAINPELAIQENAASTCDGTSTTDMKQALLFMALQKDFDVYVGRAQVASDFGTLVFAKFQPHAAARATGSSAASEIMRYCLQK